MAKKDETKEWKRSKKFFPSPQYELVKVKLFDAVKVVSAEKGIETVKDAQFLTITKAGYEPQTQEEEDRLIIIAADPKTSVVEEAQLPATPESVQKVVAKKDEELKEVQKQNEEYRKMLIANGIKVD